MPVRGRVCLAECYLLSQALSSSTVIRPRSRPMRTDIVRGLHSISSLPALPLFRLETLRRSYSLSNLLLTARSPIISLLAHCLSVQPAAAAPSISSLPPLPTETVVTATDPFPQVLQPPTGSSSADQHTRLTQLPSPLPCSDSAARQTAAGMTLYCRNNGISTAEWKYLLIHLLPQDADCSSRAPTDSHTPGIFRNSLASPLTLTSLNFSS